MLESRPNCDYLRVTKHQAHTQTQTQRHTFNLDLVCHMTSCCPEADGMQLSGVGPQNKEINKTLIETEKDPKVSLNTTNILWEAGMQNGRGKSLFAAKQKNI